MYNPLPFKITSAKDINKEVKLFRIKTKMNPSPGQFFEVSVPGVGECPLASCSYDEKNLDILIKKTGSVTSEIFNLKKGANLFIRGPYGKGFPIEEFKGKNLVMIAGGTGIAPVTSLIDCIEKRRKEFGKIKIYFGFRSKEFILLKEKIEQWKKKFDVVVMLDKSEKGWKGEVGFISDLLLKTKPGIKDYLAVLCGPEIMMETATKALNSLGIGDAKIYWSMERRMECAIGNCGRCLIQDVYVCKDGPVFRYDFLKSRLDNENSNNKEVRQ